MAWTGMNVALVEQVARELSRQSERINTLVGAVDSMVVSSQEYWKGQDAARFNSDWHADRSMLHALANSLSLLAKKASQQAADQRRSSHA